MGGRRGGSLWADARAWGGGGGVLRLDACIHQTHQWTRALCMERQTPRCLLACSPACLLRVAYAGCRQRACLLRTVGCQWRAGCCDALRCAALQYWPAADRTHAMHSREGEQGRLTHSSPTAAWNASLPPDTLADGCYSMQLQPPRLYLEQAARWPGLNTPSGFS